MTRFLKILFVVLFVAMGFVGTSHAVDVTMAWDANTEADLAGYILYWGKTERPPEATSPLNIMFGYDYIQNAGNVLQLDITIDDNEVYYMGAVAYDLDGNLSDYSDEFDYIPLGVPQNTVVTKVDGNTVRVEWSVIVSDDLKGYRVYFGTEIDSMDSIIFVEEPASFSEITGQVETQMYYYAVSSIKNDNVESGKGTPVAFIINDEVPPLPPLNLRVVNGDQ